MSFHYEDAVKGELNTLLDNAGDEPSEMHIYRKMTDAMEKPLLQAMMLRVHGNQSACAVEQELTEQLCAPSCVATACCKGIAMITEEQAKQRLVQIAMMPSVVMVGVDSKQGGVSIGMELDKTNVTSDVDDLLLGLMTAYVGINMHIGYSEDELVERSAKTLIGVLKKLTKSDDTAVTVH